MDVPPCCSGRPVLWLSWYFFLGILLLKSGGKTAALQNYSSHSSRWMPLESFQEAPATKWRWRGKTSGLRLVSQSGGLDTMDSCAAADVFFSEIFLASASPRGLRPGQSTFLKF